MPDLDIQPRRLDAVLASYGPQGPEVVELIRRIYLLTVGEVAELRDAHRRRWGYDLKPPAYGPGAAAWAAIRAAVDQAGRVPWPELGPAWVAAKEALAAAGAGDAQFPVMDAVMAISARDLVGHDPGWDWATYDAMTSDWFGTVDRAEHSGGDGR